MKLTRVDRKFNPETLKPDHRRYRGGPTYQHTRTSGSFLDESKAMVFQVLSKEETDTLKTKLIELWTGLNNIDGEVETSETKLPNNWYYMMVEKIGDDNSTNYTLGIQYLLRATYWGFSPSSEYLDLSLYVTETYIDPILKRYYKDDSLTFSKWLDVNIDENMIEDNVYFIVRSLKDMVNAGRFPGFKVDFDKIANMSQEEGYALLNRTKEFWLPNK